MLRSYIITFFRKFKREKLFSLLNIAGLTVGLATVILISLFIRDELSFDQHHSKKDSIFLLTQEFGPDAKKSPRVPYTLTLEMVDKIPAFLQIVSTQKSSLLISNDENAFYDNQTLYTSPGILELFDINILKGQKTDFEDPSRAMISENAALKYFGSTEDAIDERIKVDDKDEYIVSGVFESVPANSSLQFDFLLPGTKRFKEISDRIDSKRGYYPTQNWVLLTPNANLDEIGLQMADFALSSKFNWLYEMSESETPLHLLNLIDIHLRSGIERSSISTSDIRYVYLFTAIGALILLIAIINYTNLATAQSIKKAKEVGLRKVVGTSAGQVSRYYLIESLILVFISSIVAFAIAERCIPYLNTLMDKQITLDYLSFEFLTITLGTTLFIGAFAGAYPAFVLSKSKPLDALQSTLSAKGGMKKGLIITQFFIAQLLIIATIIIQQQLSFIQNKNLGYDREHLIEIDTHEELLSNADVFKTELSRIPGISSVSVSNNVLSWQDIAFMNNENVESENEINIGFDFYNVDHDFLNTMKMEVLQGRSFNENDSEGMVINESALKLFGWETYEGQVIKLWQREYPVVGVIKDFHDKSLKSEISPAGIAVQHDVSNLVIVRVEPVDIKKTMSAIAAVWDGYDTGRPLDYKFYDEEYDAKYQVESRLGQLFMGFAGLAIFIAILGLVGLSTFTIEQRIKEVSLRRVLGANFKQVFLLFAKSYMLMVVIGFLVAAPIVYYALSDWLTQFAYRIEPGLLEFSSSLILVICLVLIIICVQVLKTQRINPASKLRNQ